MEVYIDDMIVKTLEGEIHATNLEDIMGSVRNYNMCRNPTKYSFDIQEIQFLGFMLTKRSIEENLDKCQAIVDMRNPSNVNDVQQLTRPLATLSLFIYSANDKDFHLFSTLMEQ